VWFSDKLTYHNLQLIFSSHLHTWEPYSLKNIRTVMWGEASERKGSIPSVVNFWSPESKRMEAVGNMVHSKGTSGELNQRETGREWWTQLHNISLCYNLCYCFHVSCHPKFGLLLCQEFRSSFRFCYIFNSFTFFTRHFSTIKIHLVRLFFC
jgi:hypothetical protein